MAKEEESRLTFYVTRVEQSQSQAWRLLRPNSWADIIVTPPEAVRDEVIQELGKRIRYFIVDYPYEDAPQDPVPDPPVAPQDHGSDFNLRNNMAEEEESRLTLYVTRVEQSQSEAWRLRRPNSWADIIVIPPEAVRDEMIQELGERIRYFIVDYPYEDAPQDPVPDPPVAPQDPEKDFSLCRYLMPALCGGIILASYAQLSGEDVVSQFAWIIEAMKAACTGGADVWTALESLNVAREGFSSFVRHMHS